MTTTGSSPGVRQVRDSLGVSRKVFSRLTGYSERSIAAWESGKSLSAHSRQRILEIWRLQEALASVLEEDSIGGWLATPNPAFDGLKPLEVIERGELDRLWRMIYLLESGMPA